MKDWMAQVWCKRMHRGAMWPIHGKYVCPQCLREFPVAWNSGRRESSGMPLVRPMTATVTRGALIPTAPLVGNVNAVDTCQSAVLR